MKKIILLAVGLILVFIYLNFSYAHIYKKISQENLLKPADFGTYQIGEGKDTNVYVAVGDSLSAGVGVDSYNKSFPYALAEKISNKEKITLVPVGVPGAKSGDVLKNIDEVIKQKPNTVTLFVGINDVHGNVSEDEFKNNYQEILIKLKNETSAQVYVINLPYIGTKDLIKQPYRFYFDYKTRKFNAILKDLAVANETYYIDLYSNNTEQSLDNKYYSSDFFHPNETGYGLWANIIYANFNK